MSRLGSVLRIVFFILLILIIAETGYYVYILYFQKPHTNISEKLQDRFSKVVPSEILNDKNSLLAVNQQTRETLNLRLSTPKKGFFSDLYIYSKIEGTIDKISTEPWIGPDGVKYPVSLYLNILNGNYNYVNLSEDEIRLMRVTLVTKERSKPIQIADLKKGDKIKFEHKVNLLRNNYFSGIDSVEIEATRP